MYRLKDVAREAGVSAITVSRVINSPEKVKPETREIVRKAIEKYQYVQNPVAKALSRNRVGIIDVYIPESMELNNNFVMNFIAGISDVLSRHMYSFLILRNREIQHKCDGYIVTGLLRNEVYEMYDYAKERGCAMTLFGHTDIDGIDCVDVDNVYGAECMTDYLIEKGHRKIAMINVAEDKDYTLDRLEGYRISLGKHGIAFDQNLVLYSKNDEKSGYEVAKRILRERDVTALFCGTDVIALGAMRAARELRRNVPDDISVAGYDGLGYQLLTDPKICTVQQPVYQIGQQLAQIMMQRLDRKLGDTVRKLVRPKLLIADSVAEARR